MIFHISPSQDFEVTDRNFFLHEENRRYKADLALIKLPRKAELNGGTQLACLPLPGTAQQVGLASWTSVEAEERGATVVGWGYSCYEEGTNKLCQESDQIPTQAQQYLKVRESLISFIPAPDSLMTGSCEAKLGLQQRAAHQRDRGPALCWGGGG